MKKRRLTTTAVLATLLSSSVAPTVTQASQLKEAKTQENSEQNQENNNVVTSSEVAPVSSEDSIKLEDKDSKEELKNNTSTNNSVSLDSSVASVENKTEDLSAYNKAVDNKVKEQVTSSTPQSPQNTESNNQAQTANNTTSAEKTNSGEVSQPSNSGNTNNGQVSQPSNSGNTNSGQVSQPSNSGNTNSEQVSQPSNSGNTNSGQVSQPSNSGNTNSGQVSQPSNSGNTNSGHIQQRPTRPSNPGTTINNQQRPVRPNNQNKPTGSTVVTNPTDLLPGTPIKVTSTMTGEEFVKSIGDFAAEVAAKNDLYASVMIAQACLETGFGSSTLSQDPYFNFFGIKGSYKGQSVNMNTQEDSASGMYTINDSFRKYPSPKESFEDYAELMHKDLYKDGVLKSKTNSYQDVTNFLTGKYATDRQYAEKLNAIIEAYDLTKYDNFDGSASKQLDRIQKEEDIFYEIKLGDTLSKIAAEHKTSVEELQKQNEDKIKDVNLIYSGQQLKVGKKVTYEYKYNGDLSHSDDNNINASQGDFTLPLKPNSYTITSPFGDRGSDNHQGIDLATPSNSSVYAAKDGKVVAVGSHPSAGNYVILDHGNHVYTNYFHLNSQCVKVGDTVKAGQLIAKSGNTGNSTGPHLHFGISNQMWNGYSNPSNYLNF